MTLASAIITAAYRESNLIPLVGSPNTNQTTEAINRLNPIIMSSLGNEVNDEIKDLLLGGEWDQSEWTTNWVPDNVRLVLNLTEAVSLDLDPYPYEGQRLAVIDAGDTVDTYNLTLNGNGRQIEGAATLVISTEGTQKEWMFRSDTSNWQLLEVLTSSDEMPLPSEFDDYFIIMLALRLNPRYGQTMAGETVEMLRRIRSQIRSRYRRKYPEDAFDPLALIHPYRMSGWTYGFDTFSTGRNWPWG